MGNRIVNPYTLYIVSFGGALFLYPFDWSAFYPPLQLGLIAFLLVSFFLSGLAAIQFAKGKEQLVRKQDAVPLMPVIWISCVLNGLWLVEFIYAGGVPLYMILVGHPFNYRLFGVPTLHVFLVTFSSFYACYLLDVSLRSRNRMIFIFYIINLFPALLIVNRGMLLMNLSTSFFLYLYSRPAVSGIFTIRKLVVWAAAVVVVCLLFGTLGTLRISREIHHFYQRNLVYEVGNATPSFRESIVPPEFFWVYIYYTSPLANLQLTTSGTPPAPTTSSLLQWGTHEVLMDAFSKRITGFTGTPKRSSPRVAAYLNASTVYSGSFMYGGWYTMGLMGLVLLGLPFVYRQALGAGSRYFVTGMALLSTVYLFLIFDNMLAFAGASFQLVYPIFFSWMEKRGILQIHR